MPKRGWEIPEREATPEDVYMNRRKFMVAAGGAMGLLAGCGHEKIFTPAEKAPTTPTEEPQQPPQPPPTDTQQPPATAATATTTATTATAISCQAQ